MGIGKRNQTAPEGPPREPVDIPPRRDPTSQPDPKPLDDPSLLPDPKPLDNPRPSKPRKIMLPPRTRKSSGSSRCSSAPRNRAASEVRW
jgi:hypothetical protein